MGDAYIPVSGYGYDEHAGIDYSLEYEPVLAAASGSVQFAGWADPANHRSSYGLYVILDHTPETNYDTWYGHLSTLTVETNETVTIDPMDLGNRNRIIGISGNTGAVFNTNGECGGINDDGANCGQHLHFEARISGAGYNPVNPYGWVAPISTPDPWAVDPDGETSYDLWETYPALIVAADQYPGAGSTGLAAPSVNEARMVLDDGLPDFTAVGSCWTAASGNDGINSDYHWANANPGGTCYTRWIMPIDSFTPSGDYDVFVHLPDDATSLGANYTIFHSAGTNSSVAVAVQGAYPNEAHGAWAYLGRFPFDMDGNERILVSGQTLAGNGDAGNIVLADAVKLAPAFTYNPTGSIYISPNTAGTTKIDSLTYSDEDILRYTVGSDTWSRFFDGSTAGVTTNVNAFHILEASDDILLSFDTPTTVPMIGAVDDSDIVRYSMLTNSFQMYLDGSTVGLTTDNADIDGIAFAPDGRLIISTVGRIGTAPNIYEDEDLVIFNTAQTSFSLYFDGSDVNLTATGENISGVWVDDLSGDIYLNTAGSFSVSGASGEGSDLFNCDPNSVGNSTSCNFGTGLYWNGSGHGLTSNLVDGLYVSLENTQTLIATAAVSQSSDDAGYDAAPSLDIPPIVCSASNNLYALDHNEVYFGFCPDGTEVISGFRFTNIDVPQGAIIQEARIKFTTDGPFTNTLSVQFRGEMTGNSSTFSAVIRPDNRPLTAATVPWNVPSTSSWVVWDNTESPNLSSIIQEIVNQSSWSSNNALTIVVEPQPSATPDGDRRVIAWDREGNSTHTAELTIWYTVP